MIRWRPAFFCIADGCVFQHLNFVVHKNVIDAVIAFAARFKTVVSSNRSVWSFLGNFVAVAHVTFYQCYWF